MLCIFYVTELLCSHIDLCLEHNSHWIYHCFILLYNFLLVHILIVLCCVIPISLVTFNNNNITGDLILDGEHRQNSKTKTSRNSSQVRAITSRKKFIFSLFLVILLQLNNFDCIVWRQIIIFEFYWISIFVFINCNWFLIIVFWYKLLEINLVIDCN